MSMLNLLPDHLTHRWNRKSETEIDTSTGLAVSTSTKYANTKFENTSHIPDIENVETTLKTVDRNDREVFDNMIGAVKSAFVDGQFDEAVKRVSEWPTANGETGAENSSQPLRPVSRMPLPTEPVTRPKVSLIAEHAEKIRALVEAPTPLNKTPRHSATSRLAQWLLLSLRSSDAGNRRRMSRTPFIASAILIAGNTRLAGHTLNIGPGGTLIDAETENQPPIGTALLIEISGMQPLKGVVADLTLNGIHIAFSDNEPENQDAINTLTEILARSETSNEPVLNIASTLANSVSTAFSAALAWSTITPEALFANSGRPRIEDRPNTLEPDIQNFYREILAPLMASIASDQDNLYVVAAACDGTMPVTTLGAAQSNFSGDGIRNGWHTHRALRNRAEAIVQIYKDIGPNNSQSHLIKEVSAPVIVAGRHWGCIRIGYDTPRP
jgi:hypothetical protein